MAQIGWTYKKKRTSRGKFRVSESRVKLASTLPSIRNFD